MSKGEDKKRLAILKILSKSEPRVVKSILQTADLKLVNLLSECALNVLNQNVKVGKNRKKALRKFRKHMEKLAYEKLPLKKKNYLTKRRLFEYSITRRDTHPTKGPQNIVKKP